MMVWRHTKLLSKSVIKNSPPHVALDKPFHLTSISHLTIVQEKPERKNSLNTGQQQGDMALRQLEHVVFLLILADRCAGNAPEYKGFEAQSHFLELGPYRYRGGL